MPDVHDFGAKGDGKADDSAALQHAVDRGDGRLVLPRGDYRLTKTVTVPLDKSGRFSLEGQGGGAKIVMTGPGPAFHLVGTHARTAKPSDFAQGVWAAERLPTISNVEIVGAHAEADGLRFEGTMQATLAGVLVRRCRNGIHLVRRNRNFLMTGCHVFDNSGVGVFIEKCNLHQINLTGNHISYNLRGGVVIAGSEVRNVQIVGNDIEYNYDLKAAESADVFFDCREGTVREGTIAGNTIQAVFSPGGACIRLVGSAGNPDAVGLLAITGNLIGSQTTLLDLHACRAVTVTGNTLYSGKHHALDAADSENLVLAGNTIDRNPEYKGNSTDALRFRRCRFVSCTGSIVQHRPEAELEVPASVVLDDCRDVSLTGLTIDGARTRGVLVRGGSVVRVADCTIRGRDGDATYRAAVAVEKPAERILILNNFVAAGSDGDVVVPAAAGSAGGNVRL